MSLVFQPSYQHKTTATEKNPGTVITQAYPAQEKTAVSIPPLTLLAATGMGGMMWVVLIYGGHLLVKLLIG
jgi:hypothetical protein